MLYIGTKSQDKEMLMVTESSQDLLKCAEAAARAAAMHAMNHRQAAKDVAERSQHDIKLKLDRESQTKAENVINSVYPDHSILGEEGYRGGNPDITWIIDPIDGTVNFFHGLGYWCSSVAVQVKEQLVAGCVFAPVLDECFTATCEGPALLNGTIISPSKTHGIDEALVLTGLSKKLLTYPDAFPRFERLSRAVCKVRVMGAAALDICHVACGQADAYIETSIYIWDIAAGQLIARQAGATPEILEKHSDTHLSFLCTNGRLHESMRALTM